MAGLKDPGTLPTLHVLRTIRSKPVLQIALSDHGIKASILLNLGATDVTSPSTLYTFKLTPMQLKSGGS